MSVEFSDSYKYLYIFISGIIVNIIIHFLAYQRFTGNIPFLPHSFGSLMYYYKDLRQLYPEWIDLPSIKSLLYGSLIAGILAIIILFLSDLMSTYKQDPSTE